MLLGVDAGLLKPRIQPWLLGALVVLLLVQAVPVWDLTGHLWTRHFLLGAIGLAVFLILVPVGLAVARQRGASPALVGIGAVVALALVVAIGWPKSDDYVKDRYQAATAPKDFPDGVRAALAWFNRTNPHDSRIAVVGGRPGFKQYVFYGDDLSNYVQYVAHHGPHGAYTPIASEAVQNGQRGVTFKAQCEEWRRTLDAGHYDYLVAGPDQRTQSRSPVEAIWTVLTPAARVVEQNDDVFVIKINGELDPGTCAVTPQPVVAGGTTQKSGPPQPVSQ
jgi:hypothetical protein